MSKSEEIIFVNHEFTMLDQNIGIIILHTTNFEGKSQP